MAQEVNAEERVDELFSHPPAEFVAARDRLAKELRAAGNAPMAATVKKLTRPTAAASAVNRLARTSPGDIAELLEIGKRLREAHNAIGTDAGRSAIRAATAERRALVDALVKRAMAFLATAADSQRAAIANTLEAAAADAEAGEKVRAGRLSKELAAPSGLGLDPWTFGAAEDGRPDRLPDDVGRNESGEAEARQQRAQVVALRAGVQDAERRARRSAQALAEALEEVARLEAQVVRARAQANHAQEAARQAESELASAQQEVQSAESAREVER